MNTLNKPARAWVLFAKSCVTPAGMTMQLPAGASIHSPPTRRDGVPSITQKISSFAS
jgi:hypothetical protein